jgi:hypothetical protein
LTMEVILAKLIRSWKKWIQIHGSLLWIIVASATDAAACSDNQK